MWQPDDALVGGGGGGSGQQICNRQYQSSPGLWGLIEMECLEGVLVNGRKTLSDVIVQIWC